MCREAAASHLTLFDPVEPHREQFRRLMLKFTGTVSDPLPEVARDGSGLRIVVARFVTIRFREEFGKDMRSSQFDYMFFVLLPRFIPNFYEAPGLGSSLT